MAVEVQTRSGHCPTHGPVKATRQIPKLEFPFVYYAALRWRAKRQPFLCPRCEEPVDSEAPAVGQ